MGDNELGTLPMLDGNSRIISWLVLGPFKQERQFCGVDEKLQIDMKNVAPSLGIRHSQDKVWGLYSSLKSRCPQRTCNAGLGVDLACHFKSHDSSFSNAYAAVYIRSNIDRKIVMSMSSDDGHIVWLNGAKVASRITDCSCWGDAGEKVILPLLNGTNLLMIKVGNGASKWGFVARIRQYDDVWLSVSSDARDQYVRDSAIRSNSGGSEPHPKRCPSMCGVYYDGCNQCRCSKDGSIMQCTRRHCVTFDKGECIRYISPQPGPSPSPSPAPSPFPSPSPLPSPSSSATENICPMNCLTYFDGCNTCVCGEVTACDEQFCTHYSKPKCLEWKAEFRMEVRITGIELSEFLNHKEANNAFLETMKLICGEGSEITILGVRRGSVI